jgi:hypothetical protein
LYRSEAGSEFMKGAEKDVPSFLHSFQSLKAKPNEIRNWSGRLDSN